MKVIIAGSRHFHCMQTLEDAIEDSGFDITEVLSGAADGVDKLGEKWAEAHDIPVERHPAFWRMGRKAGAIRNEVMAQAGEGLLALPCQCSTGTLDMIERAHNHKLTVHVYKVDCGR